MNIMNLRNHNSQTVVSTKTKASNFKIRTNQDYLLTGLDHPVSNQEVLLSKIFLKESQRTHQMRVIKNLISNN